MEVLITIGLALIDYALQMYYGKKADNRAKEQTKIAKKQLELQKEANKLQRLQYELDKQALLPSSPSKRITDSFPIFQDF